jgi:hypothetical protein
MNATNGRVPTQQVEGLVEASNASGLKIAGAWVNVSRFKPVELPEAGAHVRREVDPRGYIRELEVMKQPVGSPRATRDETIARLAVLKAAANFLGMLCQTREDVRSEHVLKLADKWLAWVSET